MSSHPTVSKVAESPDLCHVGEVIKNRWEIASKLSAGGFGQIYVAKDRLMKDSRVAVKVELSSRREKAQLPMELYIMKSYQGFPHAVALYGAGTHEQKVNYIVMRLIGPNLASLRRMMKDPGSFTLATTVRLAIQCVEALRDVHSLGAVHRDIKPSNFAMGPQLHSVDKNKVFILDFGLARIQIDLAGNLLPQKQTGSFQGTLRYCSLNAHQRRDLGRNDDLISYFYMIIEFLKGCLPWRDMTKAPEIVACKETYTLKKLSIDFPAQFDAIADHLIRLTYTDRPNYGNIVALLLSVVEEHDIDMEGTWDWDDREMLRNPPAAGTGGR